MKPTTKRGRKIKLEKLLYQVGLRRTYIVYNYQHNQISIKRNTDYTYQKWRAQKWKGSNTKT